MSDRVTLEGQSMCNEHMCDQNTREPFLKHMQAHLAPRAPIFES